MEPHTGRFKREHERGWSWLAPKRRHAARPPLYGTPLCRCRPGGPVQGGGKERGDAEQQHAAGTRVLDTGPLGPTNKSDAA